MIKIRNYQKSDYQEVSSILQEAEMFDEIWDSEENLDGIVRTNPDSILVAEEDGKVVGNIFLIPFGSKIIWLFRLVVAKEFRRKGIATQLINRALEIVKGRGAQEVGFYVDSTNEELLSFYKKRGFEKSGKKYYYLWKEF